MKIFEIDEHIEIIANQIEVPYGSIQINPMETHTSSTTIRVHFQEKLENRIERK